MGRYLSNLKSCFANTSIYTTLYTCEFHRSFVRQCFIAAELVVITCLMIIYGGKGISGRVDYPPPPRRYIMRQCKVFPPLLFTTITGARRERQEVNRATQCKGSGAKVPLQETNAASRGDCVNPGRTIIIISLSSGRTKPISLSTVCSPRMICVRARANEELYRP